MKCYEFKDLIAFAILSMIVLPIHGSVSDVGANSIKPGIAGSTSVDDGICEREVDAGKNRESITGEEINWQVISSGGDIGGTSTNFILGGTVSQTAIGSGGSDNFGLSHGFWQEFGGAAAYMCGDANGDETINIADAVYIIDYVFRGGPPPDPLCVGDANGDGSVNVADAVHLINYIFKGGPAPVEDCCS